MENINIEEFNNLLENSDWQDFEKLVGYVFEENDFLVDYGFVKVFKNKKRRQYDLIAENDNSIFIIDCKKWSGNRYKSSALKKAIEKQIERSRFIKSDKEKVSLIVSLLDEDIKIHKGAYIVPINRLNWFLNNYDFL